MSFTQGRLSRQIGKIVKTKYIYHIEEIVNADCVFHIGKIVKTHRKICEDHIYLSHKEDCITETKKMLYLSILKII